MASRQTYVVGALGVLVGMVVASSAQRAQTVSFAGHNPNSEIIREMGNLRQAAGYWRQRSTMEANNNVFSFPGDNFYITSPRRTSLSENVARRQQLGISNDINHQYGAAPTTGTVRGEPAVLRQNVIACLNLSRQRLTRCIQAAANGEPYTTSPFVNQ